MSSGPKRVRLEKRGDYFYAFVSGPDGKLAPSGASTKLVLNGPFYVGIGVSAHDKDATETAVFSNVKIEALAECRREARALQHARDGADCVGRPASSVCSASAF